MYCFESHMHLVPMYSTKFKAHTYPYQQQMIGSASSNSNALVSPSDKVKYESTLIKTFKLSLMDLQIIA
jgi:hypothetical protein